ncbi:hypothetical protein GMO_18710 [Gluconobacter morbifer G707]|uniref:Uncharacterized protein n=1 Tax=Gluconobacter morbifer G707 TaxID=1088869 RepID=G6XJJ9_9PROT|nr:hypothetical protein GMO_18710 [Gluconobacter morbifer G707]
MLQGQGHDLRGAAAPDRSLKIQFRYVRTTGANVKRNADFQRFSTLIFPVPEEDVRLSG